MSTFKSLMPDLALELEALEQKAFDRAKFLIQGSLTDLEARHPGHQFEVVDAMGLVGVKVEPPMHGIKWVHDLEGDEEPTTEALLDTVLGIEALVEDFKEVFHSGFDQIKSKEQS